MGDICITQFGSACCERYRIQTLLGQTAATYQKSFHPKRCSFLICKKPEGPKYEAAKAKNIKIVNFLWLMDSIKYCKQMDAKPYAFENEATQRKMSNVSMISNVSNLGDLFGANLQKAVANFGDDDASSDMVAAKGFDIRPQSNLNSPALGSTMPPHNELP